MIYSNELKNNLTGIYRMNKISISIMLAILIAGLITCISKRDNKIQQTFVNGPRNGVAVILTGAAARYLRKLHYLKN